MKIAIMQPYFFPYIGQFQLIHASDRFILCDDVQYIRHGWINRNRVLKPNEGYYYITVPLAKHSSVEPIKNIRVIDGYDWKQKIMRQVEHYKKKAPFYPQVCSMLTACFSTSETNIAKLNAVCFKTVCDYIGIDFTVEISSELGLDYSNIHQTDEWAIRLSEQLGASEYLNPVGGINLYSREKFRESNITLRFLQPKIRTYNQGRPTFEPALSIIDVMMFNAPSEIKTMLNDYELL
ncbi:MAG TPA: WbqC family protein [Flavisolibacter sp.]|nr:WbqC family protein [Flavisolibacter sp.]